MDETLSHLRETLLAGQRFSKQGSYHRRAPAKKAVPFLVEARTGLRAYTAQHADNSEAWRLLSQAEECLLNYRVARDCLERAMSLSAVRDRKDLKRLALLQEYESKWVQLALTPGQLADLGQFIGRQLTATPCDHTLRITETWLRNQDIPDANAVVEGLRNHGGYCDCEVLANVVRG